MFIWYGNYVTFWSCLTATISIFIATEKRTSEMLRAESRKLPPYIYKCSLSCFKMSSTETPLGTTISAIVAKILSAKGREIIEKKKKTVANDYSIFIIKPYLLIR